jgi:cytoskeletal protein CcmA (bactofilin family)
VLEGKMNGSTIVIKGDITAHEDFVISGRVEGSISVTGHVVTVMAGAEVVADIQARAIIVSGQVLGSLCADERVELQPTAQVEGEMVAPSLTVRDGATFKGKAETTRERKKSDLKLAS